MIRRLRVVTLVLALASCAPPARASGDPWRPTFEALSVQPGQERTAFDYLQRLPMEVKVTAAFHVALARSAKAVDNALWASRAVMVLDLFLRPTPPPDLGEIKAWLTAKGLRHHQLALAALSKGDDAGAAREYLVAVRCDQAVLGFDNRRLRESSYGVMDKLVRAHSDDPQYWGHLAFYSYFYGHLAAAREALQRGLVIQREPYMRWIFEEGLRLVERDEKAGPGSAASPARTSATRTASATASGDPMARSYVQARRTQIQEELAKVESALAATDLGPRRRKGAPSAPASPANPPENIQDTLSRYRALKDHLSADLRSAVLEAGFRVSY